jgi:hypothetical protein
MWKSLCLAPALPLLFCGSAQAASNPGPPSLLAAALAAIPEPSAWMTVLAALACVGVVIARRP